MISTTVMARQYSIRAELIRWGCSMEAMNTVRPRHNQRSIDDDPSVKREA